MSKKRIVFTGGGSAGHVTPNIAIINELNKSEWEINYIGSKKGIEKELIEKQGTPYFGISSGKLRRYFDFENFIDIFKVLRGCFGARRILKKLKPQIVFSKGGFVSVPVILAAKSLSIPIYIHESDITPGLANKISKRFATRIYTSFEEAAKFFPKNKTKTIGSPIRKELFKGSAQNGLDFLRYKQNLPILTIMGGSLGAKKINDTVRGAINELTSKYQIVHLCGKGNLDESLLHQKNYKQFEYLHGELANILAATNFVITRGGSNSIFEFLALNIPMIIIPLSRNQSRGDQILNGKSFEKKGYAIMLEEENLDDRKLLDDLDKLTQNQESFKSTMMLAQQSNALDVLVKEINEGLK